MLDLEEEKNTHPDDEQIEQYALGMLTAETIPAFEQHVLICPVCQDRLAETDASVQGIQAEARELRLREMRRRGKAGGIGTS